MHVAADVYQLAIVSHYVLVVFDCPLPLVRWRNESVDAGAFPRRGGAESHGNEMLGDFPNSGFFSVDI